MKKEKVNNKPELDIENMSVKSESVKMMLMSEPDSKIHFEVVVRNGVTDASLSVVTSNSKVCRQWGVATTDKFALKLIALLDNQEELTANITAALSETEKDFLATRDFVRKEWDVR